MLLRPVPSYKEAGRRGRKGKSREVGKEGERQAKDCKGESHNYTYNEWEEMEGSGRCKEPEDDARGHE